MELIKSAFWHVQVNQVQKKKQKKSCIIGTSMVWTGANWTLNHGLSQTQYGWAQIWFEPSEVRLKFYIFKIFHQDSLKTLRKFRDFNNSIFYTLLSLYIV